MNRRWFVVGFVLAASIITYQDVKNCHDLPWPPRLIATGLFFGLLDMFSLVSEQLAAVMATGVVIGFALNTFTPVKTGGGGIAPRLGDAFRPSCKPHSCTGTAQPASYQSIDQTPPGTQTV
jgi:hypothetical protein